MTEKKRYSLDFEEYDAIWIDDNVENKSYTIRNDTIKGKELQKIVDLLNEKEERIWKLEKINNICEEQITELRRLVHIVTNNNFIKDSKKEAWKKELMGE